MRVPLQALLGAAILIGLGGIGHFFKMDPMEFIWNLVVVLVGATGLLWLTYWLCALVGGAALTAIGV